MGLAGAAPVEDSAGAGVFLMTAEVLESRVSEAGTYDFAAALESPAVTNGFADTDWLTKDEKKLDELKTVVESRADDRRKEGERYGLDAPEDNEQSVRGVTPGDISLVSELFKRSARPVPHVAGRPIFAEQVAIAVAALVEDRQVGEARTLAEALAQARPDYAIGVKMRDLLADEAMDPAERNIRIAALGAEARKALESAIAEARRRARLRRVLDERLLALVENRESDARSESVLVTVLVRAPDKTTTKALREAGLEVEAASKSLPIVVGRATGDDLETIALLDTVRRIEPTRMQ